MKSSNQSDGFLPFKGLKSLVKQNNSPKKSRSPKPEKETTCSPSEELRFGSIVKDVTPIICNKVPRRKTISSPSLAENLRERWASAIAVTFPKGHTRPAGLDKKTVRRLQHGEFLIQGRIDLHGHNCDEAKESFDLFLSRSIHSGKRVLLIIHGRGLSSLDKPVLKNKVHEWLATPLWHSWVLATCPAKAKDGGGGATYLLLRKNPDNRQPVIRVVKN